MDCLQLEANQLILIPIHQGSSMKIFEYLTQPKDTLKTISTVFQSELVDIEYFNSINQLYLSSDQPIKPTNAHDQQYKKWDH
jgi:hypothetical protein